MTTRFLENSILLVWNGVIIICGRNATNENSMFCAKTRIFQTDKIFATLLTPLPRKKQRDVIHVTNNPKPHIKILKAMAFDIPWHMSPAIMATFQAPRT